MRNLGWAIGVVLVGISGLGATCFTVDEDPPHTYAEESVMEQDMEGIDDVDREADY